MEQTPRLSAATRPPYPDNSPLLVMVHAEDGEILQISPNWFEVTGYSREEIRTFHDWLRLAHGPEMPVVAERISLLHATGGIEYAGEYRIRTQEGGYRIWNFASTSVPPLPDGRRALASMAVDVTEARHDEERLVADKLKAEAASASKSRFLAAASHDLRQPLHAIRLFVGTLRAMGLNREQQEIVHYLENSAKSLDYQIKSLLDISRLDVGMVKASPVPADIRTIFGQVSDELESLAAGKGLDFRLRLPRQPPALRTDPTLLLTILRNLVGNAVKYTDRGGLLLAARVRRHHLAVQVWDTGVGIAREHQSRIYEEFFQVAPQRHGREKGLGLGLSIARRVADLLDYELVCRSRLGRGSVFEIRIPLVELPEVDRPSAGTPGPAGALARFQGRRCILVEDDPLVGRSLEFLFHRQGVRVAIFPCAEEALAYPGLLEADFYLADFYLSGKMNGIEFLARVEELAGRRISGLVLTGANLEVELPLLPPHSRTVLRKPLNPGELFTALGQLLADREECPA